MENYILNELNYYKNKVNVYKNEINNNKNAIEEYTTLISFYHKIIELIVRYITDCIINKINTNDIWEDYYKLTEDWEQI